MIEMSVEFTLAIQEAKSDRRLKEYELPYCASKVLKEVETRK